MSTHQTPIQVTGKHILTQEEKDGKLAELLSAIQRKEELDAEKKQVVSGYKNKLDEQESNIKVISNLLNMGFEHRPFSCYLTKDFDEGKRFYHEVGSGRLISTEPLTAADYQTQMDLDEAKIKANNEIEIGGDGSEFRIVPVSEIPFEEETPAVEPAVIDKPIKQKEVKTKTVKIEPKSQIEESSFGALSDEFRDEESDPFNFGDDI